MVDKWLVETDLSDEWDFYTRANVGEVFPDPVAPLSFFYFQHDDPERGRILGGSETGIPQRVLPHRRDDARRAARRRVRLPRDHRRVRLPQCQCAADARSPRAEHDGQGHRRRILRGCTRRAGVRGEARLRPTGADREDRRDVRLGAHHTRPARRARTRADGRRPAFVAPGPRGDVRRRTRRPRLRPRRQPLREALRRAHLRDVPRHAADGDHHGGVPGGRSAHGGVETARRPGRRRVGRARRWRCGTSAGWSSTRRR